jgi:hypothetical protein
MSGGGVLAPYRSEPLLARPATRMRGGGSGLPAGWTDNYFLQFAPNVKQVATHADRVRCGPLTKEKMIGEFWESLGFTEEDPNELTNKKSMKEIEPEPWEVRARLKEMIQNTEDKKEEKLMGDLEYPLLVKGEVSQKLKNKQERKREDKKRKIVKEKKYVEEANDKLNKGKDNTKSKSKEDNTAANKMYRESRAQYHKKAAPGRHFKK